MIIGGGIDGLAVALALKQQGIAVTVYEQAEQPRESGAGIWLWAPDL
jgi:2-polyprenyl-6-methoxyphenol hydroxylase-like FAD-dependent oxidoreductase